MATVTGLTKERMLEIEAASIVNGDVDEFGHLILERHDESTIDAGSVIGPAGGTGPTGSIMMFGAAAAPTGWLLCNGASLLRAGTYADLFAVIGTTYGSVDGTHFNVPNLKGKVVVGVDAAQTEFDTLGETGGTKTHTLTSGEMPSHGHTQDSHGHGLTTTPDINHTHQQTLGGGGLVNFATAAGTGIGAQSNNSITGGDIELHKHTVNGVTATNQNTGGGTAHNNLQPYMAVNYIIKI